MKYIIQKSVSYEPKKGILRSENNSEEVVQLTKTASALLLTLINDRDVITRDVLLERVWGSQGLLGSYNNLNQYLSILRRAFRLYGLDDIIFSIPRMGVQLNPEIEVEKFFGENEDPTDSHSDAIAEDDINSLLEESQLLPEGRKTPFPKGHLAIYFNNIVPGALLLSLSLFILSYIIYAHQPAVSSFTTTLPVPGCRVDALEHVDEQWRTSIAEDFTRVQKGLSLRCDTHHQFLFYYDSKIKDAGLGNTLLSQCTPQGDNPLGFCNNYFFYNWR